jgi:hypothetical protein
MQGGPSAEGSGADYGDVGRFHFLERISGEFQNPHFSRKGRARNGVPGRVPANSRFLVASLLGMTRLRD